MTLIVSVSQVGWIVGAIERQEKNLTKLWCYFVRSLRVESKFRPCYDVIEKGLAETNNSVCCPYNTIVEALCKLSDMQKSKLQVKFDQTFLLIGKLLFIDVGKSCYFLDSEGFIQIEGTQKRKLMAIYCYTKGTGP